MPSVAPARASGGLQGPEDVAPEAGAQKSKRCPDLEVLGPGRLLRAGSKSGLRFTELGQLCS